jgi:hypothetical protein
VVAFRVREHGTSGVVTRTYLQMRVLDDCSTCVDEAPHSDCIAA